MLVDAKKAFYAWLQAQFSECEIIFPRQQKEPAGNTWMRVYVLKDTTSPTQRYNHQAELQINFSIFTSDASNVYALDVIEEKLKGLIEKRKLSFDAGTMEFREFDTTDLEDNTEITKLQKIIFYKSIMVTAYLCNIRR